MIGTLFGKTENNKNGKKDSYQSRIPEELLSEKKVENRNIKTCVVFLIAVSFIKKQIKLD